MSALRTRAALREKAASVAGAARVLSVTPRGAATDILIEDSSSGRRRVHVDENNQAILPSPTNHGRESPSVSGVKQEVNIVFEAEESVLREEQAARDRGGVHHVTNLFTPVSGGVPILSHTAVVLPHARVTNVTHRSPLSVQLFADPF